MACRQNEPATLADYQLDCGETVGGLEEIRIPVATEKEMIAEVYTPPCYGTEENRQISLPTLYLLHGGGINHKIWSRLGMMDDADQLIIAGEIQPLLIVAPKITPFNTAFSDPFITDFLPEIETRYRTDATYENRAIGGVSAGAHQTIEMGLDRRDLFSAVGLHAPARRWHEPFIDTSAPQVYLDIGKDDGLIKITEYLANSFDQYAILYEYHINDGGHDLAYLTAQIPVYLRWYDSTWGK